MTTVQRVGTRLLVGGELLSDVGAELDVTNPSTGAVQRSVPLGDTELTSTAIGAARAAFDNGEWSLRPAAERAAILHRLGDLVEQHAEDFTGLVVSEVGTVARVAGPGQVARPMDHYRDMVAKGTSDLNRALPVLPGPPVTRQEVIREPRGVVSAITPWNAPHLLNLWKVAPALATGNTLVLKPAPEAPSCALLLGELAVEAGVPAGVLNVVTGGVEVGERLVSDPRVDMVTFTGSSAVGRSIARSAADTLKHTLLELGGKSALLALDDADIASLTRSVLRFVTLSGQGCGLLTRVLVPDTIHDDVVDALVAAVARVRVGPADDPEALMGPVISESARDRIERTVSDAAAGGAEIACGGGRPDGLPTGGFYLEPTILTGVTNDMPIAREEVFGPVVCVFRYSGDVDEGVRLANDSAYGLVGAVWTQDVERGRKAAQRIRAGQVKVNAVASSNEAPFGGFKQSGVGRECGIEGVQEYTAVKYVAWPDADSAV
ncbi:aldehyde dehydrogenase family protein [Gordonia terrae]